MLSRNLETYGTSECLHTKQSMTEHKGRSDQGQSDQGKGLCARAVWITAGQRNEKQAKKGLNSVKHPNGNQACSLTASMERLSNDRLPRALLGDSPS